MATTMPPASAAPSGRARPAAASLSRSSSRSFRRYGRMSPRKRRLLRRRRRLNASSLAKQSTSTLVRIQNGGKSIRECLRIDAKGRVLDTQYRLVSRGDAHAPQGNKEHRARPPVKIAKPIRPMPASSNQVPSAYDTRYGWDSNGRNTYQPDFWRGSSQPNPQLPRTDRYQRADPFWSNR